MKQITYAFMSKRHKTKRSIHINVTLIALVLVQLLSCQTGTKQKKEATTKQYNAYINGKIEGLSNVPIRIFSDKIRDTAHINNDGLFYFELNTQEAAYLSLVADKKSVKLFISPTDSLTIHFNASDIINTINFKGKGAAANLYLKSKYQLMAHMAIPSIQLYEYAPKRFKYLVDSFYVVQKINFDAFLEKEPSVDDKFIRCERASIKYERATKLYEYLKMSSYANTINKASFLSFEKQLSCNDDDLMEIYEYESYLKAMIDFYATEHLKNQNNSNYSPQEFTLAKMQQCVKRIKNQAIKDHVLYNTLKEHVGYYGYKETDLLFKSYAANCKNDSLKIKLTAPFEKYQRLTLTDKAPALLFYDKSNKAYTFDQFKGQYIYIDVWATWCLPCRKQSPYFQKLAEANKHKNIQFISLSIDKKESDWLDYQEAKHLHNNQYIIKDIEQFLNDYQIKTVPHFLIIDPTGKIMNANAPRPSEKEHAWLNNIPNK